MKRFSSAMNDLIAQLLELTGQLEPAAGVEPESLSDVAPSYRGDPHPAKSRVFTGRRGGR